VRTDQVKRLKELEKESARLKTVVADPPLGPRPGLPIAQRFGMLENLDKRVPVDPELTAHAPVATLLDFDQTSNLCPLLHVRKHL
jgi:hypothetical protein